MRVKTFQGRTLEEVLPDIREELGPNAVVLGQKNLVAGGVGGFFGKRMIEVTAADRMPSDTELVELEDSMMNGDGGGSARGDAQRGAGSGGSSIDLHDDWDPADDDDLAQEYGSVLRNSSPARQPTGSAAPAAVESASEEEARVRAAIEAAFAAAPPDMVAATRQMPQQAAELAPSPQPSAAPRGGAGTYGPGATSYTPLDLPERSSTVGAQAPAQPAAPPREPVREPLLGAVSTGSYDTPDVQARKLAARAHQAISEATREIEQQLAHSRARRPNEGHGSTFRAEVMQGAGAGYVTPDSYPSPADMAARDLEGIAIEGSAGYLIAPSGGASAAANRQAASTAHVAPRLPDPDLVATAGALERELVGTGVDLDVAQSIVHRVLSHRRPFSAGRDPRDLMRDVIAETLNVDTGWAPVGRSHRIAVVGASGAGSSTVVAKLAEGYQRAGARVGVISVIAGSNGHQGNDPLLRRDSLQVHFAANAEQVVRALERLEDHDLVLLDTPSAAYLDAEAARVVANCLAAAHVDDVHVVVPLASNVREVESVVDHFRSMGANRLVVSKIDESRFAGQLLNFGFRVGLPITYLSDGPRIPEDLRAASAGEIAGLIVPSAPRKEIHT